MKEVGQKLCLDSAQNPCSVLHPTRNSLAGFGPIKKLSLSRPATYQIEVQGCLDERRSDWFDGMAVAPQVSAGGTTITKLTGAVVDQAALHGLLRKLYDLGLPLLSVTCTDCHPSSVSPS